MGGSLESRCVGRVCGADVAVRRTAYVPETCRDENTLIKLPCCIKLAFQIISILHESDFSEFSSYGKVLNTEQLQD